MVRRFSLARGSATARRFSTDVVPRSWRTALADGISASRNAEAATNHGEVILRRSLPNGLGVLHLGASQKLTKGCPGNGGLRLWQYESSEAAGEEAARLGKGMEVCRLAARTLVD